MGSPAGIECPSNAMLSKLWISRLVPTKLVSLSLKTCDGHPPLLAANLVKAAKKALVVKSARCTALVEKHTKMQTYVFTSVGLRGLPLLQRTGKGKRWLSPFRRQLAHELHSVGSLADNTKFANCPEELFYPHYVVLICKSSQHACMFSTKVSLLDQ